MYQNISNFLTMAVWMGKLRHKNLKAIQQLRASTRNWGCWLQSGAVPLPRPSPILLLFFRRQKKNFLQRSDEVPVPQPDPPKPVWEAAKENRGFCNPCLSMRKAKRGTATVPVAVHVATEKHWLMAREYDPELGTFCSVFHFSSLWLNDLKQITTFLGFICPHPLKCGNNTFEDCGKA